MKEQGSKHYFFIIKINKHTQIIKPEMVVYLMPSQCPLHDQSIASKVLPWLEKEGPSPLLPLFLHVSQGLWNQGTKVRVSAEKYTEGYENAKANLVNKHVRVFGVFLSGAFLIIVGSSNSTFTIAKLHSKSDSPHWKIPQTKLFVFSSGSQSPNPHRVFPI